MNVLLVDNGTSFLEALKSMLAGHTLTIVSFQKLGEYDFNEYDLVILSGGHKYTIMGHHSRYAREFELIRDCRKPLVGICLGFEIIVIAFGGSLKLLRRTVHGEINISFSQPCAITNGRLHYKVFESHQRGVKRLPPSLLPLAQSRFGVEIVKHRELPIYGFQFHPEQGNPDGTLLFEQSIQIETKMKQLC